MAESARVIAVVNRKGGVGKTTTAIQLADGLSRRGKVALLIDLDPQGNVTTALGLAVPPDHPTLAELLVGEAAPEDCILPSGRSGLWILPSYEGLAQAKVHLLSQDVTRYVMRRMGQPLKREPEIYEILAARLQYAQGVFDFMILDCPPSLDTLAEAVYYVADEAVVPVKVDYLGTEATGRSTDDIVAAQAAGYDVRITQIVPTFFRRRELLGRQMLQELRRTYTARVSAPVPQAVAVEQAPATGQTLFEYAPDHVATKAYERLVARVLR